MQMKHPGAAAFVLACVATVATADVVVKRDPPDVQVKTFDPTDPPAEMPHLNNGEAAVTSTSFRLSTNIRYEPTSRTRGDDRWTAMVAVHGLTIRLQLQVIEWLPRGVSVKLKAHEEGHCKISEQVYQQRSAAEAKAAGAGVDGHNFRGTGATWRAAAENAVDQPIKDVGKDYLTQTADIADRVNRIYDDITAHGTNDIPEAEAIKKAFDRFSQERQEAGPTTSPASSQ